MGTVFFFDSLGLLILLRVGVPKVRCGCHMLSIPDPLSPVFQIYFVSESSQYDRISAYGDSQRALSFDVAID